MSVSFHIIMPHTLKHTHKWAFPLHIHIQLICYLYARGIALDICPVYLSPSNQGRPEVAGGILNTYFLITASVESGVLNLGTRVTTVITQGDCLTSKYVFDFLFCFVLLRNILWLGTLFSNPTLRYILIISFWVNQNCIVAWYLGTF